MSHLNTRVFMGIPTLSSARRSIQWISSLAALQMPLGSSMARQFIEDKPVAEARNELCRQALAMNAKYVFFLSDDVLTPDNTILVLLDKITRVQMLPDGKQVKPGMITGIYWTKTYPSEPYIYNNLVDGPYLDWKVGEFFPVNLAGCDCLLIDTEVLKTVPFPWFSTDWVNEPGQKISPIATEDFYFFTKARKYGFHLFADTSIQCIHEDRNTGAGFGITTDMRQLGGLPLFDNLGEEKLAADIGAGHWSPVWDEKTKLVRFDGRADVNPDYICDLHSIPEMWFNKFDYIYSGHVIEHFAREEVRGLIIHWLNLLKIGGQFEFRCPNVEYAMRRIIERIDTPTPAYTAEDMFMRHYDWQMLYGSQQGYDTAFHRTGFVARTLFQLLNSIEGLTNVSVELYNNDQELRARGTLSQRIEVSSLLEWWNEIEQQENISVHSHLIKKIIYPSLDEIFNELKPEEWQYLPSSLEVNATIPSPVQVNSDVFEPADLWADEFIKKTSKRNRQAKVLEKDCK